MDAFGLIQKRQYGFSSNRVHLSYPSFAYKLEKQYAFDDFFFNKSIPIAMELKNDCLAIASENGFVSLLESNHLTPMVKFQAHLNVIFDIKWRPSHNELLTASGDQSMVIWDMQDLRKLHTISSGHNSSIKSVSFFDPNLFASGGRDGFIRLWDLRMNETNHQVLHIKDAHKNQIIKKKERRWAAVQRSNPNSVVTSLLFSPDNLLYSSGANDGCIKLWDLRFIGKKNTLKKAECVKKLDYCGSSTKAEGFTSLALDFKHRVYAGCSDNRIYAYDTRMIEDKKEHEFIKVFEGSLINNFTKVSVLNDELLLSGSKDSSACVWSLKDAQPNCLNKPMYVLRHGMEEVSSVISDPRTYSIYSCDDDIKISKWVLNSSSLHKQNTSSNVAMFNEAYRDNLTEIKLINRNRPILSPKTPPLTSLNNWLVNSTKQNDLNSSLGSSPSTSVPVTPTSSLIQHCSLLALDSPVSLPKRKAPDDGNQGSSSKKPRASNNENRKLPRSSKKKNLFPSDTRSIRDYFTQ